MTRRIKQVAKTARHVHSLAHGATSAIGRNGTEVASTIKGLRERFQEGKKAALKRVRRAAAAVRSQAAGVDKKVRAKPYQALGLAAGAGIVAGYLISRRRSRAS
ncbi:MAG TPA: DUF883 C-terminal domain-containing protein [Opitutaceae bacterium]